MELSETIMGTSPLWKYIIKFLEPVLLSSTAIQLLLISNILRLPFSLMVPKWTVTSLTKDYTVSIPFKNRCIVSDSTIPSKLHQNQTAYNFHEWFLMMIAVIYGRKGIRILNCSCHAQKRGLNCVSSVRYYTK